RRRSWRSSASARTSPTTRPPATASSPSTSDRVGSRHVAGRRARTGRGWDAAPARPRRRPASSSAFEPPVGGVPAAPEPVVAPKREPTPAELHEKAREICLRQLSFRPRTRAELAAALKKREIPDEIADAV